ncbi:hypothetical protein EDB83DRAFT_2322540 [Lactarius deliciosus]|nr:hypothetical protein EDB83DRAFT_2322540 [Lactarius deliciosus]
MSHTLFAPPTTLAKYRSPHMLNIVATPPSPTSVGPSSPPLSWDCASSQFSTARPCSPLLLNPPTLTLLSRERLVGPHPHRIGSPHDSSWYQDYLCAALAPDVHTRRRQQRVLAVPASNAAGEFCGNAFCTHLRICEALELCDPAPRDAPLFNIAGEERLQQDIVDEALVQGVWITRTWWLHGQEFVEACPSIWLAVTASLSRKERSRQWQQREGDQDCGGDAKTIRNHGDNNNEGNHDDHGSGDDDTKTITAAAATAMVTRRQSRTTAVAATTTQRQSRWWRQCEDDCGGGDDNQGGGSVGDSGSDEGGGWKGDVDGIG